MRVQVVQDQVDVFWLPNRLPQAVGSRSSRNPLSCAGRSLARLAFRPKARRRPRAYSCPPVCTHDPAWPPPPAGGTIQGACASASCLPFSSMHLPGSRLLEGRANRSSRTSVRRRYCSVKQPMHPISRRQDLRFFFRSRRIVSRLMVPICGWARAASVSSATVQRLAPAGGAEQARAATWACSSLRYGLGLPGRAMSCSAKVSPPCKYAARAGQMAVRPNAEDFHDPALRDLTIRGSKDVGAIQFAGPVHPFGTKFTQTLAISRA